jgi:hypothetical protein
MCGQMLHRDPDGVKALETTCLSICCSDSNELDRRDRWSAVAHWFQKQRLHRAKVARTTGTSCWCRRSNACRPRRSAWPSAPTAFAKPAIYEALQQRGVDYAIRTRGTTAVAGGEPSEAPPVRGDASTDLGRWPYRPADRRAWPETVGEERTAGGRSVRKNVGGSCRAAQFGPPDASFDARSISGGIRTQARPGWCRMRPIKGRQIGKCRPRGTVDDEPSVRGQGITKISVPTSTRKSL